MAYIFLKDTCLASAYCRIQMSISISGATNDGLQTQSLFPLYMLLARPVSTTNVEVLLNVLLLGESFYYLTFKLFFLTFACFLLSK